MSKFLYPIYKLKTKSYIKWWLYHKKAGGSGVLSEILEGFSFNLENTLNRKFNLFEIEGNSTQNTTTGKNLLPNNATTQTINGVKFTVNEDGTVKANGTATAESTLVLNSGRTWFTKTGTFILSGCPKGEQNNYIIRYGGTNTYTDNGNGKEITENDENVYRYCQITIKSGISVNNLVFKPMIRLASITDDTYEPYTGGIASPNPNYEQPILSAGDNGSINEKIKNADGTEEQDYSIFVQQPMRSIRDVRDCFVNVNGNWYERHMPYIASYNGETLPQDVYNEVDNVKYCNEKSMSTTGQFSIGASVQYIDENNWNDLPCTPEQIQQLENKPSTYKDFTIINSEDETKAHLKIQYYKEG